jgi:hypothetical protein
LPVALDDLEVGTAIVDHSRNLVRNFAENGLVRLLIGFFVPTCEKQNADRPVPDD